MFVLLLLKNGGNFDPTRNIYSRIGDLEMADETNSPLVQELVEHTGYGEFPLQYLDVQTDSYQTVGNLYDYSLHVKKDVDYISGIAKQTEGLSDDLARSLGSASDSTLDTTAWV